MNLRMIGLAAVVVFTALLPLAAFAGPADGPPSGAGGTSGAAGLLADAKAGLSSVSGIKGSATAESAGNAGTAGRRGTDALGRPTERCGPEVVSPEGIEAQTYVLTAERDRTDQPPGRSDRSGRSRSGRSGRSGESGGLDTWARTYYRNETGGELLAVLSLMGPYGRTVQTRCPIDADDEPAVCETPREPSRGGHTAYMAVVEFSAPANSGNGGDGGETEGDGAEIEPLLLRSGSNSPAPAAG
ncbi:hypothetical protein ACIRQP_31695 [Streptomyces sp. NPDC102274]|uniref:hypothetical protein n=1 Tax=Streptomyces sp. NPDC102274 TaxID=3366151 RepID=UPI0038017D6A